MTPSESAAAELGRLGEALVADWLQRQGWRILERQWRCRWGELDLVALRLPNLPKADAAQLAFVEVKTRSRGNWDSNGLMAITASKQAKLWQAAQFYLVQHSAWAEVPCRFDVALVGCLADQGLAVGLAQRPWGQRQLVLQAYLENAFELA